MTRAYALALGVGTQVFTLDFGKPILGSGELATAVLLIAAWCINLPLAEYLLRRSDRRAQLRHTAPGERQVRDPEPAVGRASGVSQPPGRVARAMISRSTSLVPPPMGPRRASR